MKPIEGMDGGSQLLTLAQIEKSPELTKVDEGLERRACSAVLAWLAFPERVVCLKERLVQARQTRRGADDSGQADIVE